MVQVKGGGVGRDARGWYSIDRNGERWRIKKNPAAQAQRGRFAIIDYLRRHGHGGLMSGNCSAHMVCSPNRENVPSSPSGTPCRTHHRLGRSAEARHQAFGRKSLLQPRNSTTVLSQKDCRIIADALMPSFEVPSRWAPHIWQQRFAIEQLTDEQQHALEMLNANRLISLSGPAGSGKTIAALQRARQVILGGDEALVLVPTGGLGKPVTFLRMIWQRWCFPINFKTTFLSVAFRRDRRNPGHT